MKSLPGSQPLLGEIPPACHWDSEKKLWCYSLRLAFFLFCFLSCPSLLLFLCLVLSLSLFLFLGLLLFCSVSCSSSPPLFSPFFLFCRSPLFCFFPPFLCLSLLSVPPHLLPPLFPPLVQLFLWLLARGRQQFW